jgi:hypothetical protein
MVLSQIEDSKVRAGKGQLCRTGDRRFKGAARYDPRRHPVLRSKRARDVLSRSKAGQTLKEWCPEGGTFSITPGLDRFRPGQTTEWPGLYLAGDWTATEWPSTMEGAVRSGRLAAGAVVGDDRRFLAPETPASGLMRWLSRD